MKHIFVCDQSKCIACSACMMGCLDQNDTDVVGGDLCYRKTFDNEVSWQMEALIMLIFPQPVCTAWMHPASRPVP